MSKRLNLVGQRFGRWVVLSFAGIIKTSTYWTCVCDCGNTADVHGGSLRSRSSKSCGCFNREQVLKTITKHGQAKRGLKTRTYYLWRDIIRRCNYPNFKQYKDYGGRGITICDRWLTFENFYADVGDIPPGMTFDRTNNNGNYEPGNWRQATWETQQNNTRKNDRIEFRGETKTLSQWARHLGMNRNTLWQRLYTSGWSIERAFTTPVKRASTC
jgi:hypothetical protein